MGNVAISQLSAILQMLIVGLREKTGPTLQNAIDWLDRPTELDSQFGESRYFHRLQMSTAKGIGYWMLAGTNTKEVWEQARALHAQAVQERWIVRAAGMPDREQGVWGKKDIPTLRLDDYMALCFQSESYEVGIEEFERYHGNAEPSMKKVLTPRAFGYALCLHQARQRFEPTELLAAGQKMLRSRLQEAWLGGGQSLNAAMWLKIVYWHHDQTLTPLQTILKAYDDMPDVVRPQWLQG